MHYSEVRKHRRFDLQFPISMSFPTGEIGRELEGITKNVSLGGVLIKVGTEVPIRTKVRLRIDVVGPRSRRPVRLSGEGEVVRVEALEGGVAYRIAVQCDRLAEIEGYLFEMS